MRILKRVKHREGAEVKVVLEEPDDVWALFNFISEGDVVRAVTLRKVQRELAGGGVSSETKRVLLSLRVTRLSFEGTAATLRVSGVVFEESAFARKGAHHTLELGVHEEVSIKKDVWDSLYEKKLQEATDSASSAQVHVLLIQPGLAQLLAVTSSLSRILARVTRPLPKNRGAYSGRDKALNRFFGDAVAALQQHLEWGSSVKAFVIAGPGFCKDEFFQFLVSFAQRSDWKAFLRLKDSAVLVVSASSAFRHSLNEVLANPRIQTLLRDTLAVRQAQCIDQLFRMLNNSFKKRGTGGSSLASSASSRPPPCRGTEDLVQDFSSSSFSQSSLVCYGKREIQLAVRERAVKVLMISEALLRSATTQERRLYVQLLEDAAAFGAETLTFSDSHSTGVQLGLLGGVAAILLFPISSLDEEEETEEREQSADGASASAIAF